MVSAYSHACASIAFHCSGFMTHGWGSFLGNLSVGRLLQLGIKETS